MDKVSFNSHRGILVIMGIFKIGERKNLRHRAGSWIFLKIKELFFGLKVDKQVDEFLSPLKPSDATKRYFARSQMRFNDWIQSV